MERYIREKLLPDLENVGTDERRHYRLHHREIMLSYICTGELIEGRYWSIQLKCKGAGEKAQAESCRVWDAARGCLCPIDLFLPRSLANKYEHWEFALESERVRVFSKAKGTEEWISRTNPAIGRKRIDKRRVLC